MAMYTVAPIPEIQAAICRVASQLYKRHFAAHRNQPEAIQRTLHRHFEMLKVTWRQHKDMTEFLNNLQDVYSLKIKGDLENA